VALTGPCWLSMVRRRSTVRFRKGGSQVRSVFRYCTADLSWGIPVEGTGQRLGWKPEPSRGRMFRMVRDSDPARRRSEVGHCGGQDRYQAALRGCVRRWSSPLPPRALPADWYGQGRAPGGRVAPRKDPAWVRENPRSLPLTCRPATAASNWSEGCEASADGRAGTTRGAWRVTNGRWA